MRESIDIFNIHQKIMDDYKHFVSSFINIKDEKIKEVVENKINQGKFWPEPLIQFNPSFEQGESAQSLCDKGILHPDLSKIFKNYDLFKHQVVDLVLPMDLMGVYILLPDRGKNILKDERPTSNVQHRTSNNDVAPLFKLF